MLNLLQQSLFIVLAGVACCWGIAFIYTHLPDRLAVSLPPNVRSNILLFLCLLPLVLPLLLVFLALLPSILVLAGLADDHCLVHSGTHFHFCLVHEQAPMDGPLIWAGAGLSAGMIVIQMGHLFADILASRRLKDRLFGFSQPADHDYTTVVSDTPFALTQGLLQPIVFLSTGLLDKLSGNEHDMILAHENQHVARRDNLRQMLARAFSLGYPPGIRRQLLSDMALATEQVCDQASAQASGNRALVAELLLKVERIYGRHFNPAESQSAAMLADNGNALTARVQALLAENERNAGGYYILTATLATVGMLLAGHGLIHDWLEHLLMLAEI